MRLQSSFRLTFFADIAILLILPNIFCAKAEQECQSSSKILLQASLPKPRRTSAPTEDGLELLEEAAYVQVAGSGGPLLAGMKALHDASKSASDAWHSFKRRQEGTPKEANLLSGSLEGEKAAKLASISYSLLVLVVGITLGASIYMMLQNREAILKLMLSWSSLEGKAAQEAPQVDVQQVDLIVPEDRYFCPDLVVPAGCECILLVPTRRGGSETQNITDSNGSTVLSIISGDAGMLAHRVLVAANNVALASCCRSRSSLPGSMLSDAIEFELLTAAGDVWAHISYKPRQGAEDRCIITTKNEQQLHMVGSVRYNALNMTDHQGGLLATTEPVVEPGPLGEAPGSICRLHVAPMADVGLVLCSLICLQHLSSP